MHIVYSQSTDSLKNSIIVKFSDPEFTEKAKKKMQKHARGAKIDGFRKGKVPVSVIEQLYGKDIRHDIALEAAVESFYQAVKEKDIAPATQPHFDKLEFEKDGEITFTASFEVMPTTDIGNLSDYQLERQTYEVSDADVAQYIDDLRGTQPFLKSLEGARGSQDGDTVEVKPTGTIDGEPLEGAMTEAVNIVIGSKEAIPEFSDALRGANKGEVKEVAFTYPENEGSPLSGKSVALSLEVLDVKESSPAELDAEFFKGFGITSGDIDEFKEKARQMLVVDTARQVAANNKQTLITALHEKADFLMPQDWVAKESELLADEMKRYMGQHQNAQVDLSFIKPEAFKSKAEQNIRINLIFTQVREDQKIEVSDESVDEYVVKNAVFFHDLSDAKEYFEEKDKGRLEQIKGMLIEEQIVDYFYSQVSVTNKIATYDDLMKDKFRKEAVSGDADSQEAERGEVNA